MNVALLGAGLMGAPMAERLLESGHRVIVYNRTRAKVKSLKDKGVLLAETPSEAVKEGECIILMLSDASAIEEVLFSGDEAALDGRTVIQMGTIAPSQSIEIQKKVFKRGGEYLECPVLGSRTEAREGALILMVGATKEKFEKWNSLLKAFGPKPQLIGEVGKASALKLALNQLIAAHAASFSLSLGLIQKSNVDVDAFMGILRESALFAPMFDKKLPKWLKRNYANPNFPVKHLLKDVDLILKEADSLNLSTEHLQSIYQLLAKAMESGLAESDYSAIFEVINPS